MTIEFRLLGDDCITVGELKKYLSNVPDDYALHTDEAGTKAKSFKIKTDKKNSWCTITLE